MENLQQNYEWVELPSRGRCYPIDSALRRGKVRVAYLTAKDENLTVSKKHHENKTVCQILLNSKVIDTDIDSSKFCSGDKEAIIMWLLKTGYGNIRNRATNETIDFNKIEYKEFNLESDENGYFRYFLPNNMGNLVFRYLPFQEEESSIIKTIQKVKELENTDISYIDIYRTITIPLLLDMIVSVENVSDIEKWLSELSSDELRSLQQYITNYAPGLNIESTEGLAFDDSIFYKIDINNAS